MKNLLPIFALLLLVGCTSELDRCIEANVEEISPTWQAIQLGIEPSIAYSQCYSDKADIIFDRRDEEGLSNNEIRPELNKIRKDCFSEHHKEDSIRVLSLARKEARKEATMLCNAQGIY
jgi:hypothetical protein